MVGMKARLLCCSLVLLGCLQGSRAEAARPVPHKMTAQDKKMVALALSGKLAEIKRLVAAGAKLDARDARHRSLLHLAAERGHLALARWLLDRGVAVDTASRFDGTPLHSAAFGGHRAAVELLIKRKATLDPRIIDSRLTPLLVAAGRGHATVVDLLIKAGADVKAVDRRGNGVLAHAVTGGHLALVKQLVKAGRKLGVKNHRGQTLMHIAAEYDHAALVDYLAAKGVPLEALSKWGNSPMLLAAAAGKLSAVRALRRRGAGLDTASPEGWTPLHNALYYKHKRVAAYLIGQKGVNLNARVKKGVDHKDWRPIHLALAKELPGLARQLVRAGVKLDGATDGQYYRGWTALHFAAGFGRCKLALEMLRRGASVTAKTKKGEDVLKVAHFKCKEALKRALRQRKTSSP
jgi:ankyrin repeat protein